MSGGACEGPAGLDDSPEIGRLHLRDDGADLEELLILLEEKEWARQWFVEQLRSKQEE